MHAEPVRRLLQSEEAGDGSFREGWSVGHLLVNRSVDQSGAYSATMTYLKAVKAAGTTDADKVMTELKKSKIDDMFASGGYIRADGVMVHKVYVMQVKTPEESRYPWDYYKIIKIMNGEEAFGPITGACPVAPKS